MPLDGTAHAEGGIASAVAIAAATGGRLRLVRVIGPVMSSAVFGMIPIHPAPAFDEVTVTRNDIAHDYLQGIVARIRDEYPQVDVSTEVDLATDAATAIIESCRRGAADLVVIPTHARGVSRLLVSAVGDRLLRDGPDAVLFVRPGAHPFSAAGAASSQEVAPVEASK